MAYTQNEKSTGLDVLTTLDTGDLFIVGDVSDSGRAKAITEANLVTELESVIDLGNLQGQIDLTTQVTGLLPAANIDINDLTSDSSFQTAVNNFVTGGGGGANLLYDAWDDFFSNGNEPVMSDTDPGGVGSLNWEVQNGDAAIINGEVDHTGIVRISDGSYITLGSDAGSQIKPIGDIMNDGNTYTAIVTPTALATGGDATFAIGQFAGGGNSNSIFLTFDETTGDITFNTRSTFPNIQTTNLGAFSTSDWYEIKFEVNGASVECYLGVNGATPTLVATHSTQVPVSGTSALVAFNTNGSGTDFDIDFFGMKYGRVLTSGGGGNFQTKEVSISSAQILDIHNTPVELVPAPGAGKVIIVQGAVFSFTVGGTQYTDGDALVVSYGTSGASVFGNQVNTLLSETLINGSTSFVTARSPQDGGMPTSQVNDSIILAPDTAVAFNAGDGTLKVFITYQIFTL